MNILTEIDWQPILVGGIDPPLLVFIALGLVIVAVVGLVQWRRVRIGEAETSLKIRMIERGYTPEQIGHVLQTKMVTARHMRWRRGSEFLSPSST